MKNSIVLVFLFILLVGRGHAQTMTLHSLTNKESGVAVGYNQQEFKNWLGKDDATAYTMRVSIDRKLSDVARLSFLPCLAYKHAEIGSTEARLSPSCHVRYTKIVATPLTDFGYFYRGDGGFFYENLAPDDDPIHSLTGQVHVGAGIFYDFLNTSYLSVKPFLGLFIQGESDLENETMINKSSIKFGWDVLGEFGIEFKISEYNSIFGTWTTSFLSLAPKFYIGMKVY